MHDDLLFVMAEIAAAFAGFSSLVAAISRRGDDTPEQVEFDFRTLRNVLLLSLQAILFALVPVLLERQGLSSEAAFRAAAALFAITGAAYVAYTIRSLPAAYREIGRRTPLSFQINAGMLIVGLLSQAASALGLLPIHTYLLALAVFIYCAGFGFVRLFVSHRPA